MHDEYDVNTYLGSLVDDIHNSLKANHHLHHHFKKNHQKLSMRHVRARCRSIGARLADLPVIYSGNTSEKALVEKYNNGTRWSVEHQYPRQVAGYDLYYWAVQLESYGDEQLTELIEKLKECRTVNMTTKQENKDLYQFQLYGKFKGIEQSYKEAGIVLLNWPKGAHISNLRVVYPHLTSLLDVDTSDIMNG